MVNLRRAHHVQIPRVVFRRGRDYRLHDHALDAGASMTTKVERKIFERTEERVCVSICTTF